MCTGSDDLLFVAFEQGDADCIKALDKLIEHNKDKKCLIGDDVRVGVYTALCFGTKNLVLLPWGAAGTAFAFKHTGRV